MPTSRQLVVDAVDRGLEVLAAPKPSGTSLDGPRESPAAPAALLDAGNPFPRQVCPRCGRAGAFEEIHCWDCWERFVPARHAQVVGQEVVRESRPT